MLYVIQCEFDTETDMFVRKIWKRIADAGISARMLDKRYTPHITLFATRDEIDINDLEKRLYEAFLDIQPIQILLGSFATFMSESGVLYLSVVPNRALLDLHNCFFEQIGGTLNGTNDFHKPGRWIPHCTMLNKSTGDKVRETLTLLGDVSLPVAGKIDKISLVAYPACEQLATISL